MATVTSIRLPLNHRINVGEYESVEVMVDLEATIDPGETVEHAYAQLREVSLKLWRQEAILTLKGVIARRRDQGKDYSVPDVIVRHLAAQKG